MNLKIKKASILNIIINVFLMLLNLIIGFIFSSFSFISKGFESLQDILTAIIIHFSIKLNNKEKDENHPFGHSRAENIVGYTLGIIMILLGIEIISYSFDKFFNPSIIEFNFLLFIGVIIALICKLFLYIYIKNVLKTNNSPALKANLQDHLNDIIMYIGLFITVIAIKYGYYFVDLIVAIIIGLIIISSGFEISKENSRYLMGISASKNKIKKIKSIAINITEVLGINFCKSQYLGNKLQVEIHIALNPNLEIKKAHDIANQVRDKIKEDDEIISCFVHIDQYIKKIN